MPSVLSAHNLLIAAIFVPYFAFMVTLGAYIWHTGRHRPDDPPDTGGEGRLPPLAPA